MLNFKKMFFALLMILSSLNGYSQYDCGCGFVTINSLTLNQSMGPGCNVVANVSITATSSSCVNASWTWNTSPSGSSGSIYVGYSINGSVPFTATNNLSFYMPLACSSLDENFINFFSPEGQCSALALPIDLKSIYQKKNNLVWEVASESNCANYVVEWSNDAQSWMKIGEKVCNNASLESVYSLEILDNYLYIRLVQNDLDGHSNIAGILKWENTSTAKKDPSYGGKVINKGESLVLPQDIVSQKGTLHVFDAYGKDYYNGPQELFDSSALTTGHYIITYKLDQPQDNINLRLVVL